jgi:DNA polymerase-3 subunit chi
MTRVSFYILKSNELEQRQAFACRLVEKIYHQGQQIYIHTDSAESCEAMNQALWAVRPDSFSPHDSMTAEDTDISPVLIGYGEQLPPRLMDVMINLSAEQPMFFSQFERVCEIVDDDAAIKQAGRQRFQFYKHRGYQLDTFHI